MNPVAAGLPPKFNVFDPALLDDPYPTYARLRHTDAVCRAGPATWAVTRHAEAAALLRDPRLGHGLPRELRDRFAAGVLDAARPNAELPRLVSALDPPDHTRIRGLLKRAMASEMILRLREVIRTEADALIGRALDLGSMDVVADLALPLQTRVSCELLDVPPADRDEVARQATALGRAIILIPFVTEERGNGEPEARWLRDYVSGLLSERHRTPGDDLISNMIDVRHGGDRLSDDEIIDNAVFLFFAGFETSIHVVAGGCAALFDFPDQLTRLACDRALAQTAVEEILRFDPPLQWISRVTVAPVAIDGRTVRPGRFLLLLLASANRDERAFHEPDRLDVGRHPNPHLGFGGGAHHCLGVALARAQGAIVFNRLVERCAVLEPSGVPVRRSHPNVRGYASVPTTVRAA